MWKRGEIAPKEQFLLFSTLFYIYISNFRSQITYSFVKCVVQYIVFLTLSTLICRGMDISKCFSESLGIRDNESRLYMHPEDTEISQLAPRCSMIHSPDKPKFYKKREFRDAPKQLLRKITSKETSSNGKWESRSLFSVFVDIFSVNCKQRFSASENYRCIY